MFQKPQMKLAHFSLTTSYESILGLECLINWNPNIRLESQSYENFDSRSVTLYTCPLKVSWINCQTLLSSSFNYRIKTNKPPNYQMCCNGRQLGILNEYGFCCQDNPGLISFSTH